MKMKQFSKNRNEGQFQFSKDAFIFIITQQQILEVYQINGMLNQI